MVFEGQTQFRKAQNMAALLALIILIGIVLPIPIGAGFADWMNSVNAPVKMDERFKEIEEFDLDGTGLEDGTGFKPYFTWYNASGDQQKHPLLNDGTGIISAEEVSDDDEQAYIMVPDFDTVAESLNGDDGYVDWGTHDPTWVMYFNYTAVDAYEDNVIRLNLNITSSVADTDLEPSNVTMSGKGLISLSEDDTDEKEPCSVVFTTKGMESNPIYSTSLDANEGGDVEEVIEIPVNWLREAIMTQGATSYFMLKIVGHDIRDVEITDSQFQSYNVNRLFGRDDGLYLVAMISVISAALGIFLVQPRYSLPLGNNTGGTRKRRGY